LCVKYQLLAAQDSQILHLEIEPPTVLGL
jgi:hypothetical protein